MPAVLAAALGAIVGALTPWVARRFITRPAPAARPTVARPSIAARLGSCSRLAASTAGAGSFGLLAVARAGDPALPAFLAVAACGLPLAAVDAACLRLPDPLVFAAGALGAAGLTGAAVLLGTPNPLLRAVAAGFGCAAAYVVLALLPGSRLGFGDVKLAGVLGLPLGWLGWPAVLLGVVLAHLINGIVALALLLSGRASRGSALPFGPAMLLGALLAVPLA